MNTLNGKVALITGASSGIGYAVARLFAGEGASLVVTARRQSILDALVSEIETAGGRAIAIPGDVRDEALAEKLIEAATETYGGLDIAFNNAGIIGEMKPASETSLEEWRDMLDTNLTAGFLGAKYQIPALIKRGGGSVIFTSSFVGNTVGMPGMAAYAASKAGLVGLAKALAAEHGSAGVRANALLPGGTDTPMNIAAKPDADPGLQEFVDNLHALKRMAAPGEIAQSALYLASDASSFVTGTGLLVDGGVSISRT